MQPDIDYNPRVIAEFSKRKILQRIVMYLAYPAVGFALYVRWNPDFTLGTLTWGPLFGIALGLGIALYAGSYLFWRCPACNKFLGFNRHAVSCSHCKARFVRPR